jgi:hypothetical protein
LCLTFPRLLLYLISERQDKASLFSEGLFPNQISVICEWVRQRLDDLFSDFPAQIFENVFGYLENCLFANENLLDFTSAFKLSATFLYYFPSYIIMNYFKNNSSSSSSLSSDGVTCLLTERLQKNLPALLVFIEVFRSSENYLDFQQFDDDTVPLNHLFQKYNSYADLKCILISFLSCAKVSVAHTLELASYDTICSYLKESMDYSFHNIHLEQELDLAHFLLKSIDSQASTYNSLVTASVISRLLTLQRDRTILLFAYSYFQTLQDVLKSVEWNLFKYRLNAVIFNCLRHVMPEITSFSVSAITEVNTNQEMSTTARVHYSFDGFSVSLFKKLFTSFNKRSDEDNAVFSIVLKLGALFSFSLPVTMRHFQKASLANFVGKEPLKIIKQNALLNGVLCENLLYLQFFHLWIASSTSLSSSAMIPGLALFLKELFAFIDENKERNQLKKNGMGRKRKFHGEMLNSDSEENRSATIPSERLLNGKMVPLPSQIFPSFQEENFPVLFPLIIHYVPSILFIFINQTTLKTEIENYDGHEIFTKTLLIEKFEKKLSRDPQIIIQEFSESFLPTYHPFYYSCLLLIWLFNRVNSFLCDYYELLDEDEEKEIAEEDIEKEVSDGAESRKRKTLIIISLIHSNIVSLLSVVSSVVELLDLQIFQINEIPIKDESSSAMSLAQNVNVFNVSHLFSCVILVLTRFCELFTDICSQPNHSLHSYNHRDDEFNALSDPMVMGSPSSLQAPSSRNSSPSKKKKDTKKTKILSKLNQLKNHLTDLNQKIDERLTLIGRSRNGDFILFLEKYFQSKSFPIEFNCPFQQYLKQQYFFLHSLPLSDDYLNNISPNGDFPSEDAAFHETVMTYIEEWKRTENYPRWNETEREMMKRKTLFQTENCLENELEKDFHYLQNFWGKKVI